MTMGEMRGSVDAGRGERRAVALAVLALGAWTGVAPFVVSAVPAFDRLAMAVVPGAVILLGGAGMALGRTRAGAAVALAGGLWLILAALGSLGFAAGPFTLVADADAPLQRLQWLSLLLGCGATVAGLAAFALTSAPRAAVRPRPGCEPRRRPASAAWREAQRDRRHAAPRRHVHGSS